MNEKSKVAADAISFINDEEADSGTERKFSSLSTKTNSNRLSQCEVNPVLSLNVKGDEGRNPSRISKKIRRSSSLDYLKRGFVPICVNFSARVHHIHLTQPLLPPNPRDAFRKDRDSQEREEKKQNVKPDVKNPGTSTPKQNAKGAYEYQGYTDNEKDFDELVSLCEMENKRLSRDGIISDHLAKQYLDSKTKKPYERHYPKGRREIIIPIKQKEISCRKSFDVKTIPSKSIQMIRRNPTNLLRHNRKNQVDLIVDSFNEESRNIGVISANEVKHISDNTNTDKVFDARHDFRYSGRGYEFAYLTKDHPLSKVGRFLPNIACRLPKSSIYFDLTNLRGLSRTSQPFVMEAPHIIWGSGRDKMLQKVSSEGNPLVDSKEIEYVSDRFLNDPFRATSLLVMNSKIFVNKYVDTCDTTVSNAFGRRRNTLINAASNRKLPILKRRKTKKKRNECDTNIIGNNKTDHDDQDQLTIDDVLNFRVVDFESGYAVATFPIAISSVLMSRQNSFQDESPLKAGEVTMTLIQNASIENKNWGVEVRVTFRCVEVHDNLETNYESQVVDPCRVKKMMKKKMGILPTRRNKFRENEQNSNKEVKVRKIADIGSGERYYPSLSREKIVEREMFYDPECFDEQNMVKSPEHSHLVPESFGRFHQIISGLKNETDYKFIMDEKQKTGIESYKNEDDDNDLYLELISKGMSNSYIMPTNSLCLREMHEGKKMVGLDDLNLSQVGKRESIPLDEKCDHISKSSLDSTNAAASVGSIVSVSHVSDEREQGQRDESLYSKDMAQNKEVHSSKHLLSLPQTYSRRGSTRGLKKREMNQSVSNKSISLTNNIIHIKAVYRVLSYFIALYIVFSIHGRLVKWYGNFKD